MDIIELKENQLIDCNSLVQITIGDNADLWANEKDTVTLASGEICLKIEAHEVESEFYHKAEFEEYSIVYDHYQKRYEFSHNCHYGYIDRHNQGYFSKDAEYASYDDGMYISESVAEMFGYYYCSDCGINYHNEDGCDCSKYCFEYHGESRDDWSNGSEYKIGLEVEKEDLNFKQRELAHCLLDSTGWIKENDSSLDECSGFELVSPILPFSIEVPIMQQEGLYKPIHDIANYLSADYSDSCGGHINISKINTTSAQLLKEISGYLPLFYAIYADRLDNSYSEVQSLKTYINDRQKYYAFNCRNSEILEFRLFPAVKNINNLLWRIEFLRLILATPATDYKWVLSQMVSNKSLLHKHLRLVFNDKQLLGKVKQFCVYLKQYEDVQIGQKTQQKMIAKLLKAS